MKIYNCPMGFLRRLRLALHNVVYGEYKRLERELLKNILRDLRGWHR